MTFAEIEKIIDEYNRILIENECLRRQIFDYKEKIISQDGQCKQAFTQGADSAWELAKKIVLGVGGYSSEELNEIFNYAFAQEVMRNYTYLEAATKVAEWKRAKLKPQKTIMQDFFEKFPDAEKDDDGTPVICPYALGYYTETIMCSEISDNICFECWNRPLEEEGA